MYWLFTLNNPAHNEDVVAAWPDMRYAVWQLERGANGTPHLQGYVVFTHKKRLQWLKSHTAREAHWEARQGSHAQAKAYCSKEDTRVDGPWELGEEPEFAGQGKRNDLLSLKRAIDSGLTEAAIAAADDTFPVWAKHHKVINRYKMLKATHQRDWQTKVVVLWGPSGSGKSSRAREEAGPGAFWLSRPGGQTCWWDGYEGQEHVVIDEFYGWISRDLLQRIIDRYPLNVETKGSSVPFIAKKVWITSNEPPEKWWKVGLGAMGRRLSAPIGEVIHVDFPAQEVANGALAPGYLQVEAGPFRPAALGLQAVGEVLSPSPEQEDEVELPEWMFGPISDMLE